MEQYWKTRPTAPPIVPADDSSDLGQPNHDSILSEFDRHRLALVSNCDEDEGWQSEMRRYLKDLPSDVTKDTDIVNWWQVCASITGIRWQSNWTFYRTMGHCIPLSAVLRSITLLAKLHQYHVNVFFQLEVKLQRSDELDLGQCGSKSYRWWSLLGGTTSVISQPGTLHR